MKINPIEIKALGRFRDCCEDSAAGGHDVPKEMMQRLAAVGVVRTLGFGRHETTEFGDWLLAQPPEVNAPPLTVPHGWKLVPVEPNDAMQAAGAHAIRIDTTAINKIWTGNSVFRAMIAAAPTAPAAQGDTKELTDAQIKALAIDVGMVCSSDGKFMRSIGTQGGMNVDDGIAFARAAIAASKADA